MSERTKVTSPSPVSDLVWRDVRVRLRRLHPEFVRVTAASVPGRAWPMVRLDFTRERVRLGTGPVWDADTLDLAELAGAEVDMAELSPACLMSPHLAQVLALLGLTKSWPDGPRAPRVPDPYLMALYFAAVPERDRRALSAMAGSPGARVLSVLGDPPPTLRLFTDFPAVAPMLSTEPGHLAIVESSGILDHFRGVRWTVPQWGCGPSTLCILSRLPRAWWPRSEAEFRAFVMVSVAAYRASLERLACALELLRFCRGRWVKFYDRLTQGAGETPEERAAALLGTARDVDRMVENFANDVIFPIANGLGLPPDLLCYEGRTREALAYRALIGQKGLVAVFRLAGIYRVLPPLAPPRLGFLRNGNDGQSWPRWFDDWTVGDVTVSHLATRALVREEGQILDHCVGTYPTEWISGTFAILSIRRARSGERLSTAHVRCDCGSFSVIQHAGRRNAAPPREAGLALSAALRGLSYGDIQLRVKGLSGRDLDLSGLEASRQDWEAACLDVWSHFLPAPLGDYSAFRAALVRWASDPSVQKVGPLDRERRLPRLLRW